MGSSYTCPYVDIVLVGYTIWGIVMKPMSPPPPSISLGEGESPTLHDGPVTEHLDPRGCARTLPRTVAQPAESHSRYQHLLCGLRIHEEGHGGGGPEIDHAWEGRGEEVEREEAQEWDCVG